MVEPPLHEARECTTNTLGKRQLSLPTPLVVESIGRVNVQSAQPCSLSGIQMPLHKTDLVQSSLIEAMVAKSFVVDLHEVFSDQLL